MNSIVNVSLIFFCLFEDYIKNDPISLPKSEFQIFDEQN